MDLMRYKKVRDYINGVLLQIKFRDAHKEIETELLNHLEEGIEESIEKGVDVENAIDIAIGNMGDNHALGRELNIIHRPKIEWSILLLTTMMVSLGIVAMYFISTTLEISDISVDLVKNTLVTICVGVILILGLYFFDYRRIKPLSIPIYIGTSILLLLCSNFCISNEIVSIAPFLYAISLAGIFANRSWKPRDLIYNMDFLLLPFAFILIHRQMTWIVIYFAVFVSILIFSGGKFKYIFATLGAGILVFILFFMNEYYRIARIYAFLNPEKYSGGAGYINMQIKNILSSTGILGNNINQWLIPQTHTNFIFLYILYAFGWIAGIAVISLIAMYIFRLAYTAKKITSNYGRLMVISFVSILTVQFIYNIMMVLGLAPITGFTLPFISYGRIQYIINMMMIGLILSIYRRKNLSDDLSLYNSVDIKKANK